MKLDPNRQSSVCSIDLSREVCRLRRSNNSGSGTQGSQGHSSRLPLLVCWMQQAGSRNDLVISRVRGRGSNASYVDTMNYCLFHSRRSICFTLLCKGTLGRELPGREPAGGREKCGTDEVFPIPFQISNSLSSASYVQGYRFPSCLHSPVQSHTDTSSQSPMQGER